MSEIAADPELLNVDLVHEKGLELEELASSAGRGGTAEAGELAKEALTLLLDELSIERMHIPSTAPSLEQWTQSKAKEDWDGFLSSLESVHGRPGASVKQLEFARRFRSRKYRLLAAAGANRSGKTIAVAKMCACKWLRDDAPDGAIMWCISPSSEKSKDGCQRELWEGLPSRMFGGSNWTPKLGFGNIDTLHLTNDNGKVEVWFKNEEQKDESFESSQVDLVWWNEASREKILTFIQPRLLDRRGRILMDYVPMYGWQKFRVRLSGNKSWFYQTFAMSDNAQNMPDGAIETAISGMGGIDHQDVRVRVFGEEASMFGAVYKQYDPARHDCKPFEIPKEWPLWMVLDHGFRHPTACIFCAMGPDDVLYVVAEHFQSEWTIRQNCEAILAMVESFGGFKRIQDGGAIIDPSTYARTQDRGDHVETFAEQYEENGLPCMAGLRASTIGEHSMVSKVQRWFESDKIRFFESCENSRREHESWRYKENRDGIAPGSEPFEDKDNHTCDCLKMLIAEDPVHHVGPSAKVVDYAD